MYFELYLMTAIILSNILKIYGFKLKIILKKSILEKPQSIL